MADWMDMDVDVWWKNKEPKHDNLLLFLKSLRRSLWDVSLAPLPFSCSCMFSRLAPGHSPLQPLIQEACVNADSLFNSCQFGKHPWTSNSKKFSSLHLKSVR